MWISKVIARNTNQLVGTRYHSVHKETESVGGLSGSPATFPLNKGPQETSDLAVPPNGGNNCL